VTVAIRPVRLREKDDLRALFDPYLSAQADLADPERRRLDPATYPYFDLYWTETDRLPFWIIADRERAGFVLVNSWSPSGLGVDCAIAEFYVKPTFRRTGVGRRAALMALGLKQGWWELQVYRANPDGMAFWPRVLDDAQVAERQELPREDCVIHRFRTV